MDSWPVLANQKKFPHSTLMYEVLYNRFWPTTSVSTVHLYIYRCCLSPSISTIFYVPVLSNVYLPQSIQYMYYQYCLFPSVSTIYTTIIVYLPQNLPFTSSIVYLLVPPSLRSFPFSLIHPSVFSLSLLFCPNFMVGLLVCGAVVLLSYCDQGWGHLFIPQLANTGGCC